MNLLQRFFNRASPAAPAGSRSLTDLVASANQWRQSYNPLRSLDVIRVVQHRENFLRGIMADIQWTYAAIESADEDLMALVERRTAAIVELDWNVSPVDERRTSFDPGLAEAQVATLRAAYERIDNLSEAIEHLAMATFRGFAHLEKHAGEGGETVHLEPLDQWNVVRDGFRGKWKVNPGANAVMFSSLGDQYLVKPEDWIIRAVPRHLDWIGLLKFVRTGLCEKDWDAFVEIYGLPGATIIGPPNVPEGKEDEYRDAALEVAEGGSGYLPNGADVKWPDGPRNNSPFKERLQHLSEKLVMAGTGGLLTMLTAPTGIGKGPSEEHAEVFRSIARKEGKAISEVFQRQFDAQILAAAFPGKPVLAYFNLAIEEETDASAVVDDALKLSQAGYQVAPAQLTEKTGYELELKPQPVAPQFGGPPPDQPPNGQPNGAPDEPPAQNRAPGISTQILTNRLLEDLSGVEAKWLAGLRPVFQSLVAAAQSGNVSDEQFRAAVEAARRNFPELFPQLNIRALQDHMEATMGAACVNGALMAAAKHAAGAPAPPA